MSAWSSVHSLQLALANASTFLCGKDRKLTQCRRQAIDVAPLSVIDVGCLLVSLVGSAYLMAGALGPMKHPAVGWFALVPIFVSIYVLKPVFAGLSGVLWGVSVIFFAPYAGWRADALGPWSVLLIAIVPGLYAGFGAALTRWIGFSPFVLAVGWMGVELALSPIGLRLGLLGLGVEESGWLHSLGLSFGYVVAAFVVAYVNAGFICVVVSKTFSKSRNRPFVSSDSRARLQLREIVYLSRVSLRTAQPRGPPTIDIVSN
ncbi:MAG: hypothetical protein AABZ47_18480 [Planctomycetota bacterium]